MQIIHIYHVQKPVIDHHEPPHQREQLGPSVWRGWYSKSIHAIYPHNCRVGVSLTLTSLCAEEIFAETAKGACFDSNDSQTTEATWSCSRYRIALLIFTEWVPSWTLPSGFWDAAIDATRTRSSPYSIISAGSLVGKSVPTSLLREISLPVHSKTSVQSCNYQQRGWSLSRQIYDDVFNGKTCSVRGNGQSAYGTPKQNYPHRQPRKTVNHCANPWKWNGWPSSSKPQSHRCLQHRNLVSNSSCSKDFPSKFSSAFWEGGNCWECFFFLGLPVAGTQGNTFYFSLLAKNNENDPKSKVLNFAVQ